MVCAVARRAASVSGLTTRGERVSVNPLGSPLGSPLDLPGLVLQNNMIIDPLSRKAASTVIALRVNASCVRLLVLVTAKQAQSVSGVLIVMRQCRISVPSRPIRWLSKQMYRIARSLQTISARPRARQVRKTTLVAVLKNLGARGRLMKTSAWKKREEVQLLVESALNKRNVIRVCRFEGVRCVKGLPSNGVHDSVIVALIHAKERGTANNALVVVVASVEQVEGVVALVEVVSAGAYLCTQDLAGRAVANVSIINKNENVRAEIELVVGKGLV